MIFIEHFVGESSASLAPSEEVLGLKAKGDLDGLEDVDKGVPLHKQPLAVQARLDHVHSCRPANSVPAVADATKVFSMEACVTGACVMLQKRRLTPEGVSGVYERVDAACGGDLLVERRGQVFSSRPAKNGLVKSVRKLQDGYEAILAAASPVLPLQVEKEEIWAMLFSAATSHSVSNMDNKLDIGLWRLPMSHTMQSGGGSCKLVRSMAQEGGEMRHLVLLAGDLLQEVRHGLSFRALEAAALEEGHDLGAGAMVDDAALSHEQHVIKQVVRLWLGLQERRQDGGLYCRTDCIRW